MERAAVLYEAYITHACAQVLPMSWLGPTEHFFQSHLAHLGWCCLGPLGQPGHFLMAIAEEPENKQQIKSAFSMSATIVTANIHCLQQAAKLHPVSGMGLNANTEWSTLQCYMAKDRDTTTKR